MAKFTVSKSHPSINNSNGGWTISTFVQPHLQKEPVSENTEQADTPPAGGSEQPPVSSYEGLDQHQMLM